MKMIDRFIIWTSVALCALLTSPTRAAVNAMMGVTISTSSAILGRTPNSAVMGQTIASGGPPAPIAYWKLDESSGTNAADSSGNGLNGTTQNSPSWVSGDLPSGGSGNCIQLDGTNQWVQLPNSATLRPTTFTIGFWAKNTEGAPTAFARYFIALTQNDVWARTEDSGSALTARMQFYPGGGATASSSYTVSTWYYFIITYDGGTAGATLYQGADGGSLSSVASGTFTLTWESGSTAAIGALQGGTATFKGKMWHVQIWNTVLTSDERNAAFAQR